MYTDVMVVGEFDDLLPSTPVYYTHPRPAALCIPEPVPPAPVVDQSPAPNPADLRPDPASDAAPLPPTDQTVLSLLPTPLLSPVGTSLTEPDNLLSSGTFGAQLRRARQAAGITTLRQFSELLAAHNLPRSAASLGNWERDRHRPYKRTQLLPILSFLAAHGGFFSALPPVSTLPDQTASSLSTIPAPHADSRLTSLLSTKHSGLSTINFLLWLLDWRDLNQTEIDTHFPMFAHPIPAALTEESTPAESMPTNQSPLQVPRPGERDLG